MSAAAAWRIPSPGALLRLGRVSNLPTVWTNVLAGTALAGGEVLGTGAALIAMTLFYVGGMALNDAFDRAIDARERPSRPIPAGELSSTFAFAAGLAALGGGVGLMAWMGPRPGLAGLALAAAVVLYDAYHKGNPFSPLLMGLCRALVVIGAALAAVGAAPLLVLIGAGCVCAHVVGLTYAAKQESLDRVGRLWPLAALALPLILTLPALAMPLAVVLWLALAVADAWAVRSLARRATPGAVPRAVAALIAALALLDALLAAWMGAWAAALACVAAYALTRLLHRVVPGT
jgi:hypothetical protein